MARASWASKTGFIFAAAGSAVGLANIWRFPYIVGEYGGAAFILLYLMFIFLIGFPVFISEIIIGRTTQTSPSGAFEQIGGTKLWGMAGKLTVITGFIVSSFYCAIAGRILGYLVEAVSGRINNFTVASEAGSHYDVLMSIPIWGLGFHFLFMVLCVGVLYFGVRDGIERGNKIMMPALFIILILLVLKGITLDGASKGLKFLFTPDWSAITPAAILIALGQSFFTLSLGQGTMVTYGSYLNKKENVVTSCFPIVLLDTSVSILISIAVFTIVFSGGMEPNSGPGLLFNTLPWIFSQLSGGYILGVMFFLLVVLAALTSEISAMEPAIAYLMDEKGWSRHPATLAVGAAAFLFGIPSALSANLLCEYGICGMNFFAFSDYLCSSILIPLGGFLAVLLVGWKWGLVAAMKNLRQGAEETFNNKPWLATYFTVGIKYSAPILLILVFLNALGIF